LVEERLFQRFQRGELLTVDGCEALGFCAQGSELTYDGALKRE
jgi:hypothetical protein